MIERILKLFFHLCMMVSMFIIVIALSTSRVIAISDLDIPEDAVEFQDHYYKIYTGSYRWDIAKERCSNLGGHLATITSAAEQEFLETLNSSNLRLWIGGYRDDSFQWCWVTGELWDYTYWGSGEPNNSSNVISNENRVAIWPKYWNDLNERNTGEQRGYICEWEEQQVEITVTVTPALTPTLTDGNGSTTGGETFPYTAVTDHQNLYTAVFVFSGLCAAWAYRQKKKLSREAGQH